VALKVLPAETDADAAERLRREARIIANLEHPGIVPVHDVGSLPDGRVFYAMKLVSGARLDALVREGRPLGELLRIFLRICEPVAFAHAHGVIHRDLKPENVMVGPFGEVLVMDWGVAKRSDDPSQGPAPKTTATGPVASATRTAHGTVLGTPAYMAPEQARGDIERVDTRADVYALGAILYYMLTGRPPGPVEGVDGAETRTWPGYAGPRPVAIVPPRRLAPSVPAALEAVCLKALADAPEARYARADELARDVARFLEGDSVSAYPEGLWRRARRLGVAYKAPLLLILAYVVMRALLLLVARV
jgi:eukaryotic-like serine/threonine-protein kinase